MKPVVVLYNPRSVFYTMPLALLAVGSALDRERFEVRIIDGRLEADPAGAVLAATEDAVCLGVTVLTGAPIRDALAVTRAAKARRPDLPVIWGGWHPSLFPLETLAEPAIDATVQGQGEATFAEAVERLARGESLAGLSGAAVRVEGEPVLNPPRPLADTNGFPAFDYSLIPVERYFALKGRRQLDYISSQGCRFRCTFCADPYVYRRGWFGLAPERVGAELAALYQRYRFDDLSFQDETFFTNGKRVAAIAEEFRRRDLGFTWTATMRADQGDRLDEAVLAASRRAGLRRVMIGIESGSPEMLVRMRKDITLDQVFTSAEKCLRQGIGLLFNLIVGFPDEPPGALDETLRVAKQLRSLSPECEIAIFYYKPYPGNEMADHLLRQGYNFPATLEEWAAFDYVGSSGEWVSPADQARVEAFKFYQRIGWSRPKLVRQPLQALARWRCRRDFYALPIEKALVDRLRPPVALS